jgi:hypothetical protein
MNVETVDGVNCLKLLVKGHGNDPDPDVDPEWYYLWGAQDAEGNVWCLQYYTSVIDTTVTLGRANAVMWLPAEPIVGQVFRRFGDEQMQVQAIGVTTPPAVNGLGPFEDSLRLIGVRDVEPDKIEYYARHVGSVYEVWHEPDQTIYWEIEFFPRRGDLDGNLAVDLTDAVLVLQILSGLAPEGILLTGDVGADDRLGLIEALYIMQVFSGLR